MSVNGPRAVKYMRRTVDNPTNRSPYRDCPACDGSGWTVAGWSATFPHGFDEKLGIDPFAGDCGRCGGTGRVED